MDSTSWNGPSPEVARRACDRWSHDLEHTRVHTADTGGELANSRSQQMPQPLCTAGVNDVILFAGNRYDAARKTVTETGPSTRGWVNLACAGTALAKLFLLRHTEASQEVPTTRAERQAMFKMFTADVCGDGASCTVHGQPLFWADAKEITRFPETPGSVEAVWNENGAVCMDQPRRPELADAIDGHCGPLPRCTPQSVGHVVSANPR
jgi:ADYC domain